MSDTNVDAKEVHHAGIRMPYFRKMISLENVL
jgi:hypothetical protein